MTLSVEEIRDILTQEIAWCKENGQKPELTETQKGFIAGLEHSVSLILRAEFQKELDECG